MPQMTEPGPDHRITLEAARGRMRVRYAGRVIGESRDVLMLKEASYPPVAYFPRADVDMALLRRTGRNTHCPYKGEASYYTLDMEGRVSENAVWSYEDPYPAMKAISGRLAFYPTLVSIDALADEARGADVDEVVRHTDAGDGTAQAGRWPPTVEDPAP